MSMLSSWVRRQIRKRGMKAFIIKVLDIAVKATPSKKDDEFLEEFEAMLRDFEGKK